MNSCSHSTLGDIRDKVMLVPLWHAYTGVSVEDAYTGIVRFQPADRMQFIVNSAFHDVDASHSLALYSALCSAALASCATNMTGTMFLGPVIKCGSSLWSLVDAYVDTSVDCKWPITLVCNRLTNDETANWYRYRDVCMDKGLS